MANTYTQIYIHIVSLYKKGRTRSGENATTSFSQEYVELLKRFNVPHDERYLFQPSLWSPL
jgi:hypothetical protein